MNHTDKKAYCNECFLDKKESNGWLEQESKLKMSAIHTSKKVKDMLEKILNNEVMHHLFGMRLKCARLIK